MYTANIASQCAYPVVEQKEPLWKQLPRVPPSAGRDTTFEDFQRGAAENPMSQKWFIPVSHFTEYPYLDISTSRAYQHNFGSLIMIPEWVWLTLAHCVGTTELSALKWECVQGENTQSSNMRMNYIISDKAKCSCEGDSTDNSWQCSGRKSYILQA